jgi:DNA-binding NarL/FixJ family response regulator
MKYLTHLGRECSTEVDSACSNANEIINETGESRIDEGFVENRYSRPKINHNYDCEIVLIEARGLFRECLVRSASEYLSNNLLSYASVREFLTNSPQGGTSLVILSIWGHQAQEVARCELSMLFTALPNVPVIILSDRDELADAVEAIKQGAKGYISTRVAFAVAMEAIHLVQVGGTYVPAECLLSTKQSGVCQAVRQTNGAFTSRELAVIQAIKQGKPNKLIAYDLNMCESTVKVHVRNIMKKLQARNRTEVAIKSALLVNSMG